MKGARYGGGREEGKPGRTCDRRRPPCVRGVVPVNRVYGSGYLPSFRASSFRRCTIMMRDTRDRYFMTSGCSKKVVPEMFADPGSPSVP